MALPRLVLIASVLAPFLLHAQDIVPKIEYQGGHGGMDKKVKGSLLISDSILKFLDEKGASLIVVPLASIKDVSSSMDRKDASVGAKIAFGFLAKSRKEELVTVAYESAETAEGLVFKTDKNVSAGLVAKIQFHMKRAGQAQPSDSNAPQRVIPKPPPAVPGV